LAVALIVLAGCARDEVRSYRVPKEEPPRLAMPSEASATASAGALTWQAPDHWQDQGAGGMRKGSFTIGGAGDATADLSIISFPGDAGGLGPNLNRWRGQIGLAPLPPDAVNAAIDHVDTPYFHADFVDFLGEADGQPTRIVGAILEHGGESWFFKLMGPAELVAAETANFRAFVGTVAPEPAR
jgi:hypothetical protein